MEQIRIVREIKRNNLVFRLRKASRDPAMKGRIVLTDDLFTYVDFFYKQNPRRMNSGEGSYGEYRYLFYWEQARHFYNASKNLPIEAAPLTMYYCILNAVKSYLLYESKGDQEIQESLKMHGIQEGCNSKGKLYGKLEEISLKRMEKGVFSCFSRMIDINFQNTWELNWQPEMKMLLGAVPFVHNAYITTYGLSKKKECFLPLRDGFPPEFSICSDKKIHLSVKLKKEYFSKTAVRLPEEIKESFRESFLIDTNDPFTLISREGFEIEELKEKYCGLRSHFTYITSDQRIWYLKKFNAENKALRLNDLTLIFALTHRFSEIVRYRPEQMKLILDGKENWIVHEFLTMALDQFIDRLAAEITKREIMSTRHSN